ncbi:MAG: SPOR domain-containing protein [Bacteroidota bacterium]
MKTAKIILFGLALVLFVLPNADAQSSTKIRSKKKLRAELERLDRENAFLRQRNEELEQTYARLQQVYSTSDNEKRMLQTETANLRSELEKLNQDYNDLRTRYESLADGGAVTPGSSFGNDPLPITGNEGPARDNSRPTNCAEASMSLNVNTSYTSDYRQVSPNSFGVQIASYSDLCKAEDAATSFRGKYNRYMTYVRVKQVGGRRLYAIVYGAMRTRQEANNVKTALSRNGRAGEGKGAFVVMH